jgi:putative hydrolase of the HAD superfamily
MKITAVLFDYGMVLSGPPDPQAHKDMERVLRVDTAALEAAYWRHREAYDRGTLGGVSFWENVAKDLHRSLSSADLDALLRADTRLWTQPNVPMTQWAADLQRAGIKTGILSNLGDSMEAGIVARFPWLSDFTHSTFSHRLGIVKPDPQIYQHAVAGLQTPAEEILFIDDKEENVAAARRAGMNAITYTGHVAFERSIGEMGLGWLLKPARLATSQA